MYLQLSKKIHSRLYQAQYNPAPKYTVIQQIRHTHKHTYTVAYILINVQEYFMQLLSLYR